MIRIIARITSRPESVAAVSQALAALVPPTRAEAGCISYELFQCEATPGEFVTIESWADDASEAAHMKSAHIAAAFATAGPLLAALPQIQRYALIA